MLMIIEKENGEEWELDIQHGFEDPGIDFGTGLMSDYKSCNNKCIFCFIDQMPKGMRDTLYFKDDDSRLSFLQGNYVTLTNMKDEDIDRIINLKLFPINISVQTTNPELRNKMLNNRFAGDSLRFIDRLYAAEVPMNGQIVLCKGFNDGIELERSLSDLIKYAPLMESVSVVPVGLSDYREGLTKIEAFDKFDAKATIATIEKYQNKAMELYGIHFVHASDEFYLLANQDVPEASRYDGYIQLENGVGMLRLLNEEVHDALDDIKPSTEVETISIATGILPAKKIKELLKEIKQKIPNKTINLYPILNDFFGHSITVAGLVTGIDIKNQLKDKDLGERLLLPVNMFRSGEEVLLDDITREEIEKELKIKTVIVHSSGFDLINAINDSKYSAETVYSGYESAEGDIYE